MGQGYHGGNPPSLTDILDENDKVDKFVDCLLGHHLYVNKSMKHLLTANILRHWNEFLSIVQKEPRGKYADEKWRFHPFAAQVLRACHNCGITEATFNGWVEVVRHGFIERNVISMAIADCKEIGYDNIQIDSRSFLEATQSNSKQ